MTNSFMLFTIGPVQDFIAAARRPRDLANGSHMLSFLASRAVKSLRERVPVESIIFPHMTPGDLSHLQNTGDVTDAMKIAAFPNRILAVVPTEHARVIADAMAAAVRSELKAMSSFFKEKAAKAFHEVDEAAWDVAIYHAIEIMWVAKPVEEKDLINPELYLKAYQETDRLLGMRKSRRDFVALDGTGYVCSLTPSLSAVKPASSENLKPKRYSEFIKTFHSELIRVDGFEGLFSMTHYNPKINKNERKISQEKLAPLSYMKRVYGLYMDQTYSLRFERFDKMEDFITDRPYYALMLMDGDRMGKHLTESVEAKAGGLKFHQHVSKTLMEFATSHVPKMIKAFDGQLLYAGGDDVMAIIRTEKVSECANAIRVEFTRITGGLTMSAGIAVVHVQQPMREAWDDARIAEKAAKNSYHRNSVAYRIVKRSGQILETGSKWKQNNGADFVEEFLLVLKEHLEKPDEKSRKGISYKWIQDLTEFAWVSDGLDEDAVLMECKRLFIRHAESSSLGVWESTLKPWLKAADGENNIKLSDAINQLDTAYYLARGKDQ